MDETQVRELEAHGIFALHRVASSPTGVAVLAHGISADHTEDRHDDKPGLFDALVTELASRDVSTIRFDFRGHGKSDAVHDGVTIDSELADLRAVLQYVESIHSDISLVGCSFGACASALAATSIRGLRSAVLLNPVVDPLATFFMPGTPWSRQTLGPEAVVALHGGREVLLDGTFRITPDFLRSASENDVAGALRQLGVPSLYIHGSRDTYVPWELTRKLSTENDAASFLTVVSEHGFGDLTIRRYVARAAAEFIRFHLEVG